MKELSIEEKARAYDEIIKKANKMHHENCEACQACIEELIPELKESKDEKIKRILHSISSKMSFHLRDIFTEEEFQCFDAWSYAWLKKQGKHDIGISEATKQKLEDNLNKALEKETPESLNKFLDEQDYQPVNTDYINGIRVGLLSIEGNVKNINGLTESQWVAIRAANRLLAEYIEKVQQKPWSEEDEKEVAVLEAYIRSKDWSERHIDRALGIVDELVNKVKSLRPHSQWKPSDEQMDAIDYVKNFDYGGYKDMLVSLYYDLKKLRR